MKKKILVILGHPSPHSLDKEIADAYIKGAKKTFEVKKLYLYELKFDPILHEGYNKIQELEPDLKKAQEFITWAEHIVWVFPIWWTSYPALMKGFIDRIMLPGFAFKYNEKGKRSRLLKGRTSSMIMTSGGPKIWYFLFGKIMNKPMSIGILRFCGIKPRKQIFFAGIRRHPKERGGEVIDIKRILEKVERFGEKGI